MWRICNIEPGSTGIRICYSAICTQPKAFEDIIWSLIQLRPPDCSIGSWTTGGGIKHFLCVGNAYIEFRNVLYNNIYNVYHNVYNMTDKDTFVYLMEFHWKEVSVYLEKAW